MKDNMNTDNIIEELKSLVSDNEELFDTKEPAEGHFERFLSKLDGLETKLDGQETKFDDKETKLDDQGTKLDGVESQGMERREIHFSRNTRKSGSKVFWRAICFPIAASLALVFLMNNFVKKLDENLNYFSAVTNPEDPYEIYTSYMAQVEQSYQLLANESDQMSTGTYNELMTALDGITDENQPLYEILPEEISESEKAQIMKDYYEDKLKGVQSLNRYVADYLK